MWESEEDFRKDLLNYAEHAVPEATKEEFIEIPSTIKRFRETMAKNQSGRHDEINDNAVYVVSGRGKGIKDRILRPGGNVQTHPKDDMDLTKKIREVSGLGYSNHFIESVIKARYTDDTTCSSTSIQLNDSSSPETKSSKKSTKDNSKTDDGEPEIIIDD